MSSDFLALSPNLPNFFGGAAPDQELLQQQVAQGDAFKGGIPLDANGNPDYLAMTNKLMQLGAYTPAASLMNMGIAQQQMKSAADMQGSMSKWLTPAAPGSAPAAPQPVAAPSTKGANPDVVSYIRQGLINRNMNPNVGLAVAAREGLIGFDPNGNPNLGDGGSSAGPFQLHYGNVAPGGNAAPGLGDDFTKATGLDARDPSTWQAQVDFALDHAAKNGWGAFHGAAKAGIPAFAGIGGQPGRGASQVAQGGPVAAPAQPDVSADNLPVPPSKPASLGGSPTQVAQDDEAAPSSQNPYAYAGNSNVPGAGTPGADPSAPSPAQTPLSASAMPPGAPGQAAAVPSQGGPPVDPTLPAVAAGQVAGPGAPTSAAPMPRTLSAPPPISPVSGAVPPPLDPTYGGQVPAAWIAAGHSAGDWVNYARTMAGIAGNNPYAKAAGEQWGKIADGLATSIDKGLQFTNEQKNARDPTAVAYEQNKAITTANARAGARFTPENIRGAGQLASAQANAKTDVENQNTLVPVAQPDGSIKMTTKANALQAAADGNPITQSLPGYITSGQQNLSTKLADGTSAYQERQVSGERLDAISSLLSAFQTGANSTDFNNAVAKLRSFGISVPNSATINPAAMQEFAKNAYANVLSNMKEQGNKQFVSEVQSAVNSNPNPDLQPEANAAMVAQMKGIQAYHNQNFQDFASWYDKNKGAPNDAQFQIGWAKTNPISPFIDSARKDIGVMGVPIPSQPAQRVVGQRYVVPGKGVYRWMGNGWATN
ncbi:hypothetical protein [Beijerinckia sp. L45]|uniref:hypothetical protein n=1 Tax=Beijerinckia sp. L45 TaxID=1641855 RepID=UPI00131D460C|nr:hypothetical protein [Beijerinckia sp. L45]